MFCFFKSSPGTSAAFVNLHLSSRSTFKTLSQAATLTQLWPFWWYLSYSCSCRRQKGHFLPTSVILHHHWCKGRKQKHHLSVMLLLSHLKSKTKKKQKVLKSKTDFYLQNKGKYKSKLQKKQCTMCQHWIIYPHSALKSLNTVSLSQSRSSLRFAKGDRNTNAWMFTAWKSCVAVLNSQKGAGPHSVAL